MGDTKETPGQVKRKDHTYFFFIYLLFNYLFIACIKQLRIIQSPPFDTFLCPEKVFRSSFGAVF